jgi:hypothetical protein
MIIGTMIYIMAGAGRAKMLSGSADIDAAVHASSHCRCTDCQAPAISV